MKSPPRQINRLRDLTFQWPKRRRTRNGKWVVANGRGSRNSFIFMIIMEGPGLRRWTVRLDLFHLNGSSLHKDGWMDIAGRSSGCRCWSFLCVCSRDKFMIVLLIAAAFGFEMSANVAGLPRYGKL